MSDIVQEIINAAELSWKWEPEHPQYVEGWLYLTQAQWDAVLEAFPLEPNDERSYTRPYLCWGIPVQIVKPDQAIELPSGKVLVYSKLLDSFYVFDPSVARDAGLSPSREVLP